MSIVLLFLMFSEGPPFYKNPVDPVGDLAALKAQIEAGQTDNAQPWLKKLSLYTALGELADVPELVNLLHQTYPKEPVFAEALMILKSLKKEYEPAIALGEAVLREYPQYPTIRGNLARLYLTAGKPAKGINMMFAALEYAPIRVDDWALLLKNLALATPDPDKMVDTLRRKSAQNPHLKSLKYVLMVVCLRFGRLAEAAAVLKENPEIAAHPDLARYVHDIEALTATPYDL